MVKLQEMMKFCKFEIVHMYVNNLSIVTTWKWRPIVRSMTLVPSWLHHDATKWLSSVHLYVSDLNSNRLQRVQGLTFQGLSNLMSLRLRRNLLTELMDGAFYGLTNIQSMYVTLFLNIV